MEGTKNFGYVDMHVHTTCSDGSLTPEKVVQLACKEGVRVLAITDHDTVNGITRAQNEANKYGIKLIHGIECSTSFKQGNRHILGYNIDINSDAIKEYMQIHQEARLENVIKIINKLNSIGFEITLEEVQKLAGEGSIGRAYIAKAMMNRGYVSSVKEAFKEYIDKGKVAYAPGRFFSPEDAIYTIKRAGGIPVLAHPVQLNYGTLNDTLKEMKRLVDLGIEGVEVIYPEHNEELVEAFANFVNDNDLYVTCGSDFHGAMAPTKLFGKCYLGKYRVLIKKLKEYGKTFI